MMADKKSKSLTKSNKTETALDISATVFSAIPWVGGPVTNVLNGMSLGRKLGRVQEVLEGLASDLGGFESDISKNYVKTDEFEDLLEQTLNRVGQERNEEKRSVYKAFLTDAIESPGEPYDEQLRILRSLEEIQPDHIRLLKAIAAPPEENPGHMGSQSQTLQKRTTIGVDRLKDLVGQLNDLRLTNLQSFHVMMTGHGAADLRGTITEYGQRVMQYILRAG
jgi:hypothetical protein